jgi:predicted ferric reductase
MSRPLGSGFSDRQWLIAGAVGIVGYVALVALPIILMLQAAPADRSFIRELSVALAFAGTAIIGLQFLLASRFRHLKAPYGIDAVYHFHRQISLLALGLVVAHPILLVVDNPDTLALFNVLTAPWRARFAVTSLVAMALLIGLSFFRTRLGIGYELWRRTHGLLALVGLGAGITHIELVGNYVSLPVMRELWIVLPAISAVSVLWIRIVKPVLLLRSPWRVTEVRPERGDSWTLRLTPERHRFSFQPGQFAWLNIRSSPFAMAEHPFSFSSSAENTEAVEITIKELGDFTSTVGTIKPGEVAWLDGPYGQFSTDRHLASRYVFLGGGVGITPIMSMLETLADRADRRELTLFYGVPTLEAMTFRERLEVVGQRLNLQLVPVVERPEDGWEGETGFITAELISRHIDIADEDVEYFVCGPEPMMKAVSAALDELGVSAKQVRYEQFGLV